MGNGIKVISPLKRLLMDVTTDQLLAFLDRTGLQWTFSRRRNGTYQAILFMEGKEQYRISSNKGSARAVLRDVLSEFLVNTSKDDYHRFQIKMEEPSGFPDRHDPGVVGSSCSPSLVARAGVGWLSQGL